MTEQDRQEQIALLKDITTKLVAAAERGAYDKHLPYITKLLSGVGAMFISHPVTSRSLCKLNFALLDYTLATMPTDQRATEALLCIIVQTAAKHAEKLKDKNN